MAALSNECPEECRRPRQHGGGVVFYRAGRAGLHWRMVPPGRYDATTHAACRYRWTLDKGPPLPSRSDLRSLSDTPDQDPRKDPGPPAPGHDTLQPIHERDSSFKILSLRKRAPGPRLDAGRVVPQGVPQAVGNRVLRTPVFHDRGTDRSHDAPRGGPGKRRGAGFSPFWMDPGWIRHGSDRPRIPPFILSARCFRSSGSSAR